MRRCRRGRPSARPSSRRARRRFRSRRVMDAMAVSISGAQDLAGYLQPGSHVDIYANITKISSRRSVGNRRHAFRPRAPSWR